MIEEYRAACRQTRLSRILTGGYGNPDPWASSAQWHLWTDGDVCVSAVRVGNVWHEGPATTFEQTSDAGFFRDHSTALLRGGLAGKKFNTLAILFHVADEFGLSPVRGAMSSPEMYSTAEMSIADDPESVIEEKVSPGFTWQYVPLLGSRSATTVKFNAERAKALESVCEVNSPVRLGVYCAPLEMLCALEGILRQGVEEGKETELSVALLCYRRFTVMVVFSDAGIHSLTNLPHGSRIAPTGIVNRIKTEVVPYNTHSAKCSLWIVEASPFTGAFAEVVRECDDEKRIDATFANGFVIGGLEFATMQEVVTEACKNGPPSGLFRPEFVWPEVSKGKPTLVPTKATGGNLSKTAKLISRMQISGFEALLIVLFRAFLAFVILVIIVALGFGAFGIFMKMRTPAWQLTAAQANIVTIKAQKLTSITNGIEAWEKTLQPRSLSWSVMELVTRIIPENSGALVRVMTYTVEPVIPSANGPQPAGGKKPDHIGFRRTWKIDGIANERGSAFIDTISNEKIAQVFGAIAKDTKQMLFENTSTRVLAVRATRGAQSPVIVNDVPYNSSFSIVIEQTISADDELAFPLKTADLPQPAIL